MIIYTFILNLDSYLDKIRSYLIIFNGLQVNYSVKARLAQNTIHGGRMSDMGERLKKVSAAPSSSATAKRHNIDVELQGVSSLVEEMLTIAKQSYSASLTASHIGA